MPKRVSQLFTVFALLIFAAQSLASSGVVCVMLTGAKSAYTAMPVVTPHAVNSTTTQAHAAPSHCHDAPAAIVSTDNTNATSNTAAKECYYCSYTLCGNGVFSASFSAQGLQLPAFTLPTLKPLPYTAAFTSAPRSPLYRPPISA